MFFFDLDGTLLDSNAVWLDIDVEFLRQRGITPVPEDYTLFVSQNGIAASALFTKDRFGLSESPEEIIHIWQQMALEHYARHLPLKPGAKQLLEELKRQGERVFLLTSCIPQLCRAALDHHHIDHLFQAVYFSSQLGLEKSDPDLYALLSHQWEVPPEECIFFDDTPKYCAAAQEAGWQVYVIRDPLFAPQLRELQACFTPEQCLEDLSSYFPFL